MASLLYRLIDLYSLVLLVAVLLSWFRPDPHHPIVRFIYGITEPVLAPVRRVLPAVGGIDLSPLIVLAGLRLLQRLLF